MDNIFAYSEGFVAGAISAQPELLEKLGQLTKDGVSQYIDAMARVSPETLHHVYEWSQVGDSDARLFDIKYTVKTRTVSFSSSFKQSRSIKDGSRVAFRQKARIMEDGTTVTIAPKRAMALSFIVDGNEVFTKNPVKVENPGGKTQGQFAKTFDEFFSNYYAQSFLAATGIFKELENSQEFKNNIKEGSKRGRSAGVNAGRKWITSTRIEVE